MLKIDVLYRSKILKLEFFIFGFSDMLFCIFRIVWPRRLLKDNLQLFIMVSIAVTINMLPSI